MLLFSSFCLSSPFCLPLQEEASASLSASAHSQGSGSISHLPWLDLGTWGLLGSVDAAPAEPDGAGDVVGQFPLGSWMSCHMWAVRNWRLLGQPRSCPPGVYFVVSSQGHQRRNSAPGSALQRMTRQHPPTLPSPFLYLQKLQSSNASVHVSSTHPSISPQ